VTRSLTAAKKHCRASASSSSLSALHRAPYWMRHPRTVTADTVRSANSNAVTASSGVLGSTDQETIAGSAGDGFQPTASTSHPVNFCTELAACSLHAPKMQTSVSHCVCSRSSRLESCVKSASGGKPMGCEASNRLLQSNSIEGHSVTGRASGENVHQRLHCGSGGECCPSSSHTDDNAGVWSGLAECQHSACLRMSSASTHVERPWVSMYALLESVGLSYICLLDKVELPHCGRLAKTMLIH